MIYEQAIDDGIKINPFAHLDASNGIRVAAASTEQLFEIRDAKNIFGTQVLYELLAPHNAG